MTTTTISGLYGPELEITLEQQGEGRPVLLLHGLAGSQRYFGAAFDALGREGRLVVPDLLHPFFAEIAKSLSEALRKSGYYLIVSSSEEDPEMEEQEINQLLARRLDILIVASCRSTV